MVSRALAAAVLLAGCYSPIPEDGGPCAPATAEQRCPTGQRCVLRAGAEVCSTGDGDGGGLDAGTDAPPVERDRDGDGVDDARDVCPDVADPAQLDEERDGLGDACDPCPAFAGGGDLDGDGVGDACDPNPAIAGDRLIVFEGFSGPIPGNWTVAGLVSTSGGEAIAVAGENQSAILAIASPAATKVEIRAAATLASITSSGDLLGAAGVFDRLAPGTDKAIVCQLSRLDDGTQQQLRIFDTASSTTIDTAAHAFAIGMELELRLRRDGTRYACRATNPTLELAGTAALAPAAPMIGLRARNAIVSYRWLMIVTSP